MAKIDNAGKRLLELINAVLELSKIDAGKFELHETPIELGALVGDVVAMVHDRAAAKALTCSRTNPVSMGTSLATPRACAKRCSTTSSMPSSSPRRAR